ncbi:hypothetical protein KIN20_025227 [Parelaphostrongylus tenuis]|uniref:Uncharacterized protein n=1 Tax=Parelaphostrongylus tenuis TaxID=148309 RepID=A0AAD5QWU1_PARTN|nr:hypothetical protein KIN20_025227 [Parelaphostrongylus tenuis]
MHASLNQNSSSYSMGEPGDDPGGRQTQVPLSESFILGPSCSRRPWVVFGFSPSIQGAGALRPASAVGLFGRFQAAGDPAGEEAAFCSGKAVEAGGASPWRRKRWWGLSSAPAAGGRHHRGGGSWWWQRTKRTCPCRSRRRRWRNREEVTHKHVPWRWESVFLVQDWCPQASNIIPPIILNPPPSQAQSKWED